MFSAIIDNNDNNDNKLSTPDCKTSTNNIDEKYISQLMEDAKNQTRKLDRCRDDYLHDCLIELKDKLIDRNERSAEVYDDNPMQLAIKLANLLAKKYPNVSIIVKTINPGYRYLLSVAGGYLMEFVSTQKLLPLTKIKNIAIREVYEGVHMYKLPPEIKLIGLYRTLTTQISSCETEELLQEEKKLISEVFTAPRTGIMGGGMNLKEYISSNISRYLDECDDNFCKENFVLVGGAAYSLLVNSEPVDVIHCITRKHIRETIDWWKNFMSANAEFEPIVKDQELVTPYDFRMRKYTLYYTFRHKKKMITRPLVHIYTSAQYDLIPYIEIDGHNIGNIWVQCRFCLIFAWNMKRVEANGYIDKETTNRIISIYGDLFKKFRNNDILLRSENLFPCRFIGIYIDSVIAMKAFTLERRKKYAKKSYPYRAHLSK
jgi:hypothetical protein